MFVGVVLFNKSVTVFSALTVRFNLTKQDNYILRSKGK